MSKTPPIESIWRIEAAKLNAGLTNIANDVGLADDLAQDALRSAFDQWPGTGIPDQPGRWLMDTAKRRAIDPVYRDRLSVAIYTKLELQLTPDGSNPDDTTDTTDTIDEPTNDDLLRMIFTICHLVFISDAKMTFMLRMVSGYTIEEIAQALGRSEYSITRRIETTKRFMIQAAIPIELPTPTVKPLRISWVLDVLHEMFHRGFFAPSNTTSARPVLCDEAIRLTRFLAELLPEESEVHALIALMEIEMARLDARNTPAGEPILLLDQDRAHWDQHLIQQGFETLERAESLECKPGAFRLEAAIAACHVRARSAEETDWGNIVALYETLMAVAPSPCTALNHAMAVGMASGAEAGLALTEDLMDQPPFRPEHLLPSVRGDLLARLGRRAEARLEFERAANLAEHLQEQTFLRERAASCR